MKNLNNKLIGIAGRGLLLSAAIFVSACGGDPDPKKAADPPAKPAEEPKVAAVDPVKKDPAPTPAPAPVVKDTTPPLAPASGGTVKVGVLHSLSGTMAISETSLRDILLFTFDEINAAGGVLGKKI